MTNQDAVQVLRHGLWRTYFPEDTMRKQSPEWLESFEAALQLAMIALELNDILKEPKPDTLGQEWVKMLVELIKSEENQYWKGRYDELKEGIKDDKPV